MKPPLFEYVRVSSVDEALDRLTELGDEAKVLAGGQSLVPLLSLRLANPAYLVDINRVGDLSHIANGPVVRLGALSRHRDVERSGLVAQSHPLLSATVKYIGHIAIRNRGTIGGSVAHADPAAELPTLLVALDGEIEARSSRGVRTLAAAEFFEGFLTTALEPDELLTEVRFPVLAAGTGWSIQEFSRRNGDFGVVTVVVTVAVDSAGRISEARISFGGVASTAVRASSAESALVGQTPSAELWKSAAHEAASSLDPSGDLHGTPQYRRHLAGVLTERALVEAHGRVEEG
ncbi:MAG: carbon-monoxide dehydrogenase (Acceptor) [Acidimicrobiaceae bacterium]|nr:carbon-monoxide dehydrogenase (Acceptor) [Acidimicrobiaceae bacterium]